jgi:hypothetical protein
MSRPGDHVGHLGWLEPPRRLSEEQIQFYFCHFVLHRDAHARNARCGQERTQEQSDQLSSKVARARPGRKPL